MCVSPRGCAGELGAAALVRVNRRAACLRPCVLALERAEPIRRAQAAVDMGHGFGEILAVLEPDAQAFRREAPRWRA